MNSWQQWHKPYGDPSSPLSRRRVVVQDLLTEALAELGSKPLKLVSLCAGTGADVVNILAGRADREIRGVLVEMDADLAGTARRSLQEAGISGVDVVQGDAADPSHYEALVPADILMLCGVFGNISDSDVFNTLDHLPQLVATDGVVIWTRTRRVPDLTPAIRRHLATLSFVELDFVAPSDVEFTVGMHRFESQPRPLALDGPLFTFVT